MAEKLEVTIFGFLKVGGGYVCGRQKLVTLGFWPEDLLRPMDGLDQVNCAGLRHVDSEICGSQIWVYRDLYV